MAAARNVSKRDVLPDGCFLTPGSPLVSPVSAGCMVPVGRRQHRVSQRVRVLESKKGRPARSEALLNWLDLEQTFSTHGGIISAI
jgi:hypothetical protein